MKIKLIACTLINTWLSSVNIFGENQFYKIKKVKHLFQLICVSKRLNIQVSELLQVLAEAAIKKWKMWKISVLVILKQNK